MIAAHCIAVFLLQEAYLMMEPVIRIAIHITASSLKWMSLPLGRDTLVLAGSFLLVDPENL